MIWIEFQTLDEKQAITARRVDHVVLTTWAKPLRWYRTEQSFPPSLKLPIRPSQNEDVDKEWTAQGSEMIEICSHRPEWNLLRSSLLLLLVMNSLLWSCIHFFLLSICCCSLSGIASLMCSSAPVCSCHFNSCRMSPLLRVTDAARQSLPIQP